MTWQRELKKIGLIISDAIIMIVAMFLASWLVGPYVRVSDFYVYSTVGITCLIYTLMNIFGQSYNQLTRFLTVEEMVRLSINLVVGGAISVLFTRFILVNISYRQTFLFICFSLMGTLGSRIFWKIYVKYVSEIRYVRSENNHRNKKYRDKVLMVGAGTGGQMYLQSLNRSRDDQEVIGIVDDDLSKLGMVFDNKPVIGTISDIPSILEQNQIDQISVTITHLPKESYEEILSYGNRFEVPVYVMPKVEDVISGKFHVSKMREINIEDLLGRQEIELDRSGIQDAIKDQTIMVTGAGGSIGSEICRQLSNFGVKRLILLGHGENSIYLIHQELVKAYGNQIEFIPVIADIKDRRRMIEVTKLYKPKMIFHAAAHKHVPLMEDNPVEAIKNNIYGTKNIAEAAKVAGVESFVMISTDKAVNTTNVMGATKRIAEMIVTSLNEEGKTKFVVTRFGNVLGSRGSVIPLFKKQIADGGPVTVTDFRMERYFMTIPEASRLVIQASVLARGGEVFVLDMGEPVKIYDLAKKMIMLSGRSEDEIKIVEIGIRPGEKLYEELISDSEKTNKKVFDKIFLGRVSSHTTEEIMNFVHQLDPYIKENNLDKIRELLIQYARDSVQRN